MTPREERKAKNSRTWTKGGYPHFGCGCVEGDCPVPRHCRYCGGHGVSGRLPICDECRLDMEGERLEQVAEANDMDVQEAAATLERMGW